MKTNIKATNISLESAVTDYLEGKIQSLEHHFESTEIPNIRAEIELGRETAHHRQGDIFRAEINLHLPEKTLRAVARRDDLYTAIDKMKDEIIREITSYRGRKLSRFRRSGRAVKNFLRGFKRK